MRYSTPTILFKYLQYHWVAANSKGHGVHSPFVYQFIRNTLNAKSLLKEIESSAPAVKKMIESIEAASSDALAPKIKLLIARLVQSLNPLTFSVTGELKQIEAEHSINDNASIDFAFIGEDQDEARIIQYANRIMDKMHSNSWIILHGIHTNSTMEAAWNQLKQHAKIRLTIDLFSIGILFFRTEQKEKEHFIIRY